MASVSDQFLYTGASAQSDDWNDFDQFLDLPTAYGDADSASASSISPNMALPYDADMLGHDLPEFMQPAFPDMSNYDIAQGGFLADQSPNVGLMPDPTPVFDDAMFQDYQSYDGTFEFRQMVEAQAAADPRIASIKEKRREAAIALHLQRLCDATALDLDISSDSNTSFSSPSCPEGTPAPPPTTGNGGVELVLDLNMNATTNLPKKQKPRSQAQKENYIKARKYGACEKHKKQHKRCNCLEKAAARAGVNDVDVPMDLAFKQRPDPSTLRSSALPGPRSSGLPSHDPSLNPSMARSVAKVTRKVVKGAPGHDPSVSPSAVQPIVTPTTKPRSNVRPQAPQCSASVVLPPVMQASKHTGSSPGHDPSSRPSTTLQSIRTTRKSVLQPIWRWRALGMSATNSGPSDILPHVLPKDRNNSRHTSPTNTPDTGVLNVPSLPARRPQTTVSSNPVDNRVSPVIVAPYQTQSRVVPRDSERSEVPVPARLLSALQTYQRGLAAFQPRLEQSPSDQRLISITSGSAGFTETIAQVVRAVTAHLGGMFSRTVHALAGVGQSRWSSGTLSERLIHNCLSFTGRQLMSTRKGLQLFQMRLSCWTGAI
ncbi:uncharacterized protein N7459_008491 [Penicillium hispanicum]|uniref:uncharacterized protein n=1 Tax=Penicillium hispanicum TaxID=1080232 RepID=UPI00254228F1|nr:uncharacterized protein N7459_008491 [Penicillium hispanicum]KAJ5574064.1 hypothetical protein N7459_008491 [Penicillium hispanicum]